ncbi:uncharacterized protein DS421_16g543310 [Arachis hypogaea]|nr:uncharacterized protein DS421_16g543310 [Arachis hypogaea]
MNAWTEEEMRINLIRRMQHLLIPMSSPTSDLPHSLHSAIYIIVYHSHSYLSFCNLLFTLYILQFTFHYLHLLLFTFPAILLSAILKPTLLSSTRKLLYLKLLNQSIPVGFDLTLL